MPRVDPARVGLVGGEKGVLLDPRSCAADSSLIAARICLAIALTSIVALHSAPLVGDGRPPRGSAVSDLIAAAPATARLTTSLMTLPATRFPRASLARRDLSLRVIVPTDPSLERDDTRPTRTLSEV